jgi:hypothetical protein
MNRHRVSFRLALFGLAFSVAGCDLSSKSTSPDTAWVAPSPNLPGAPLIPERSVLRPFIKTSLGQIPAGECAGTAFVVSLDQNERPLVLTAMVLLGIEKFFQGLPTPSELRNSSQSITLSDAFGSMDGVVSARGFVELNEPGKQDEPSETLGSILAIELGDKHSFKSFELSETLPAVGEKVWLSAAVVGGAPSSQRQHEAVVNAITPDGNIEVRFANKQLNLDGTIGAPMLNQEGKVIAMHLGPKDPSDKLLSVGHPTNRFLPSLRSSVTKHNPSK